MKSNIAKKIIVCLASMTLLIIASSYKKEHKIVSADGYFVQLKEPGYLTEIQERVTAYLYTDSLYINSPNIIVGNFACSLPAGYSAGDTIHVTTELEWLYPLEDEYCHDITPYFKLLKIKKITK